MDKTLVKAVRGRELAPVSHGVTHITARPASSGRNHAIALHAKPIRPRTFVLLLGVDLEIAFGRRLRWSPHRTRDRHQVTVAFHHIDVFLRQRNQHTPCGGSFRLYPGNWQGPPPAAPLPRLTPSQE